MILFKLTSNDISIISIFISLLSLSFTIYDRYNRLSHIKVEKIYQANLNANCSYVLNITITNKSNLPISIYDAQLNNVDVIRKNNKFQWYQEKITKRYTSFPININAHETVDILLEFRMENPIENNDKNNRLILFSSRFPYKKIKKFKTNFLPMDIFLDKLSNY